MNQEVFDAGVTPGSPTTQNEVKMLLCYILSNVGVPMRFDQLHEALMENGLVNYFELVRALEKLLQSEHVRLEDTAPSQPEAYSATAIGRDAAKEFENVLAFSVREKALSSSKQIIKREQRAAEVVVEVREMGSGYMMDLSIPDHGDSLISFSLFAPNWEQCQQIRRNFLNTPQFIYKAVIALLTGNQEAVGKLFPLEEELF